VEFLIGALIGLCIFGALGSYIASQKNRSGSEGFILGFLFGPLGVIVEACMPVGTAAEDREVRAEATRARDQAQHEQITRLFNAAVQRSALFWRSAVARYRDWRHSRHELYRQRGIQPGPLAWYRAMSDLTQALLLGLAFALPVGLVLIGIVLILKPFGRR
jgi:hypothetical protein